MNVVRWALARMLMGLVAEFIVVPAALVLGLLGLTDGDWLLVSGGMLFLVFGILAVADAVPRQADSVIRFVRDKERLQWETEPDLTRNRAMVSDLAENIRALAWWGQVCGAAAACATVGLVLGALASSLSHSLLRSVAAVMARGLGMSAPILAGLPAFRTGLRAVGPRSSTRQASDPEFRLTCSLVGAGLMAGGAAIVNKSHLAGLMVGECWFFFGLLALCAASAIYSSVRLATLLSCLDEPDFATMAIVFAATTPGCSAAMLPRLRDAASSAHQILVLPESWRRAFYARLLSLTGRGDRGLWLALLRASANARDASLLPVARRLVARSHLDLRASVADYEDIVDGALNGYAARN